MSGTCTFSRTGRLLKYGQFFAVCQKHSYIRIVDQSSHVYITLMPTVLSVSVFLLCQGRKGVKRVSRGVCLARRTTSAYNHFWPAAHPSKCFLSKSPAVAYWIHLSPLNLAKTSLPFVYTTTSAPHFKRVTPASTSQDLSTTKWSLKTASRSDIYHLILRDYEEGPSQRLQPFSALSLSLSILSASHSDHKAKWQISVSI
jgi:hypothetical protein